MITAKQAAQIADKYLKDMFSGVKIESVMLEEVELTDDEKFWLITLSYNDSTAGIQNIILGKTLKIFKIRTDNGDVVSMKMLSFYSNSK